MDMEISFTDDEDETLLTDVSIGLINSFINENSVFVSKVKYMIGSEKRPMQAWLQVIVLLIRPQILTPCMHTRVICDIVSGVHDIVYPETMVDQAWGIRQCGPQIIAAKMKDTLGELIALEDYLLTNKYEDQHFDQEKKNI